MITVEKGEDFTFLQFDQMQIDTTGLDVGGAEAAGEGYTAFLYGERDLYRPGETAKGLALVRDGSLQVPPAMPAMLRHRDPQGRGAGDRAGADRRPRDRRDRARPAGVLADRPPHAGAGGRPEGHRHLALPGGGVRPRPHFGGDPAAEGEGRAGPGAGVRRPEQLPVRRPGRRAAGRDPRPPGRLHVRPERLRGLLVPQRGPQAREPRHSRRAGHARRGGARRLHGHHARRTRSSPRRSRR